MRKISILALMMASLPAACGPDASDGTDSVDQAVGPDGVEFVTHTIANPNCRSIVLRGTQRFKNKAFFMPKVYVATNREQQPVFQLLASPTGGYTLRLGVYFPGNFADGPHPDAGIYESDCTREQMRNGINETLAAEDKIGLPEALPINFITASLQGLDGKSVIGTAGQTDILAYAGSNAILEFPVKNEATLASVIERFRVGTQLDFDMAFSARSANGLIKVDLDLAQTGRSLEASFGSQSGGSGTVEGIGATLASTQELKMKLAQILATTDVKVRLEASTDQTFNDLAQKIIDAMILKNPAILVKPADLPPGVTPPVPPGGGSTSPTPPATPPAAGSPLSVSSSINVAAAVQYLKSQSAFHFEATMDSVVLQKAYTTWTIIKADLPPPGVEEVTVFSNAPDGWPSVQSVARGSTLAIIPLQRGTKDLSYETVPHYFETKSEVLSSQHNLAGRFSLVRDYPSWLKESSGSPAFMYDESGWKPWTYVSNWSYYNWGYEETRQVDGPVTVKHVSAADFDDYLNKIKVDFATGGRLYTLKELSEAKVSKGDPVDGSVDLASQRVVIVPGSDLKRLTIRNGEAIENDVESYEKHYFERHMGGYGRGQIGMRYSDIEHPKMVPSKVSILYVRLLSDKGTTVAINPSQVTVNGGDGAFKAPPSPPPPAPPK